MTSPFDSILPLVASHILNHFVFFGTSCPPFRFSFSLPIVSNIINLGDLLESPKTKQQN